MTKHLCTVGYRRLILPLLASVLFGCSTGHDKPETVSVGTYRSGSNIELEIAEVVFRRLMVKGGTYQGTNVPMYFLELNGVDPPIELMKRFGKSTPPVKTISELQHVSYDKESLPRGVDIPGLILRVKDIRLNSNEDATAFGSYFEGRLSAFEATFHLHKRDKVWGITMMTNSRLS